MQWLSHSHVWHTSGDISRSQSWGNRFPALCADALTGYHYPRRPPLSLEAQLVSEVFIGPVPVASLELLHHTRTAIENGLDRHVLMHVGICVFGHARVLMHVFQCQCRRSELGCSCASSSLMTDLASSEVAGRVDAVRDLMLSAHATVVRQRCVAPFPRCPSIAKAHHKCTCVPWSTRALCSWARVRCAWIQPLACVGTIGGTCPVAFVLAPHGSA